MAKVSSIPLRFLYSSFQILSNPVTGSICYGTVIARSTVGIVKDQL